MTMRKAEEKAMSGMPPSCCSTDGRRCERCGNVVCDPLVTRCPRCWTALPTIGCGRCTGCSLGLGAR